jgi:hypothetical protein
MVLREYDPESRSAGSFFKNPILASVRQPAWRRKPVERSPRAVRKHSSLRPCRRREAAGGMVLSEPVLAWDSHSVTPGYPAGTAWH